MTVLDPFWDMVTYHLNLPLSPVALAKAQEIANYTDQGLPGCLNEIVKQLFALKLNQQTLVLANPIVAAKKQAAKTDQQKTLSALQLAARQALTTPGTSELAAILHYDKQDVLALDEQLKLLNLPTLSAMLTVVIQQMINGDTNKIIFALPPKKVKALRHALAQASLADLATIY